jgi:beta-lactamase regulating signal transducer with metallopeptidase domain
MSALGLRLVWAAVQVTVVAGVAALLYRAAARRGAGAAAALAGLLACAFVTVLALFPESVQWTWPWPAVSPPPTLAAQGPSLEVEDTPVSSEAAPALSVSALSWLRGAWNFAQSSWGVVEQGPGWWSDVLGTVLLAAAGVGLMRTALGLWMVHLCHKRSRVIDDPQLAAVAEELRLAMGCRPVALRTCDELTTPAVIGWLRPVILLPADWQEWTDAERRTVLAHELAHVRRRDWLVALAAHFSTAIHFYHPLLHWLANRLRLQQELAADHLAAMHVGGHKSYLRALARLALRQDVRARAWPMPSLLSETGTLLRRIEMLRTQGSETSRWTARCARGTVWGLAALVLVGALSLQSPAQKADAPRAAAATTAATTPPFDLSYLPDGPVRALAMRPAAAFQRDAFRKHAAELNAGIGLMLQMFRVPGKLSLKVEEIEQIICHGELHTDPKKKDNPSSLMFGLSMVRTVHPFDWKAQMRTLFPTHEEVHCSGGAYGKVVPDPKRPLPLRGLSWCVVDDRTIVFTGEEQLRQIIEHKRPARPAAAWSDAWKQVEHGLLAVVIDDADGAWSRQLGIRKASEPELLPFQENAAWAVFGIGGQRIDTGEKRTTLGVGGVEECILLGVIDGRNAAGGAALQQAIEGLLAQARKDLTAPRHLTEQVQANRKVCEDMLRRASVERDGPRVAFECSTRGDMIDLMFAEMLEGGKPKAEAVKKEK